jgi:hypothetical protein
MFATCVIPQHQLEALPALRQELSNETPGRHQLVSDGFVSDNACVVSGVGYCVKQQVAICRGSYYTLAADATAIVFNDVKQDHHFKTAV